MTAKPRISGVPDVLSREELTRLQDNGLTYPWTPKQMLALLDIIDALVEQAEGRREAE